MGVAREKLLEAAGRRFYTDGIAATGIDAITAEAAVAKMSLYNNFSSKDDLVVAYLDRRHAEWLGLLEDRLQRAAPRPDDAERPMSKSDMAAARFRRLAAGANAGQWSVLGAAVLWGTTGTAATLAPRGSSSLAVGAAAMGIGGVALFIGAGRGA